MHLLRPLHILAFLVLTASGFGQSKTSAITLSFPDSIRTVLENTRKLDAEVVGSGMNAVWTSLDLRQQSMIRRHVWQLRKKKLTLRPYVVSYLGAVVDAVTHEKADSRILSKYLEVAGKVIEKENTPKILAFLTNSRTFFRQHALHYDKTFRLYARDDRYSFDYIEPAPEIAWDDTTQYESGASEITADSSEATQSTDGEDSSSSDESDEAEVVEDFSSPWMSPAPQPALEGAVIRFDKVTLNIVTTYDSVFLSETKGTMSLISKRFVGEGGNFDWSSALLSSDSVKCSMLGYNFLATKPEISAEVVKLNYVHKTPGFIPGTFEFKSLKRPDSTASSFPRFRSYQSDLDITALADERVVYRGGFTLLGRRILSSAFDGSPARIDIYNKGERKLTAYSPEFEFQPNSIKALKAQVRLYQQNDSLFHPQVRMKYTYGDTSQQILLLKDKGPMKNAPYSSSYFNVDFNADIIRWDLNSDSLNVQIEGGRNIVPMVIESIDFYNADDYRLLSNAQFTFHPLVVLNAYVNKTGYTEFYSGDLVLSTGKTVEEMKNAAMFLAEKGMIFYDQRTDLIKVKTKAIAVANAYKGVQDYDNLKIHSIIDTAANATVNFSKGYMTIRGVEEFIVSDSLRVQIKPDSSVVTLLQDRDLKFDGQVSAGNFEIHGKGFLLKYDSFYINLEHIDSINFYVNEKNAFGQEIRRKVNNSMVGADSTAAAAGGLGDISQSSGTLYISRANNKSGKEKIPNFPRLDATTGGVIYFDRREVLDGVYDRSMFFVVPPFKLDSLNDADPASINFDGTFVSSGMFPSFKDKLSTQPDKSLGFIHTIPQSGYQLYKEDGRMLGVLNMDNRGLRGVGRLDFLAASLYSQDFIFYPDSVVTRGNRATIAEKQFGSVGFPQASLPDYEMKWLPKQDKMRLKNLRAPFNFYDSTAQMHGTLTISKNGVSGIGKLETRGTELVSRNMNFSSSEFGARHARFKVKSDDPNKNLLSGEDIRLKFNLKQNYADISPEIAGVAAIDFPYAQFKTSIPKARWDLNAQKITMSKDPSTPIEDSYFYTTRDDLDSLSFYAAKAEYDLKTQQLKVSGIPDIVVADARITPENNEVLILENAKIGTLKNTTIVIDTLNGYHRLTEGVVDIISRNEFSGYATYQYVNILNDTFAIKMTNFHLEDVAPAEPSRKSSRSKSIATKQTVATGSVADKDKLVLGAGMFYKGDMTMYATRPALQLTGFVKLDIKKIKDYNTWIKYEQSGDETDVLINFDNAVTEDGKKATAGLHVGSQDKELYISFLNDKKNDDDDDFFTPSGTLFYDPEAKEYKIEDREKAAGNKLSGKVFAYNDETSQVRFEGPVNLFEGSKNFKVNATTIGSGNLETSDIRMNAMLMMESDIPSMAFDIMAKDLQEVIKNEGAAEGLGEQTELLYKIADVVGEDAAKQYEENSLKGYVSLATIPQLIKPLVIADINMKWSAKHKAFFSEGNIGISNILKNDINGGFEGFVEVRKNEDGAPVFHLFFKASPESWYYFGFEDNRVIVYSSNATFNDVIAKKSTAGKAKVGDVAFIPGTEDETLAFINKFRNNYYGIQVPYDLSDGSQAVEKKTDEKKKEDDDGF